MKLVILGAGGYGRTVADLARQMGNYEEILFLDDHSPEASGPCGDFPKFRQTAVEFYPAFGNNRSRLEWIRRLEKEGCAVAVLVHPTAYVSPTAQIGIGCAVLPKAVVNTDCVLNPGCIVNCGAIVDHGCILEEGVHVCLGAIVKAENRIPSGMKIEAGQVVKNRTYPL